MGVTRSKVSVVGAGHVGSAVANALVLLRACDQVILYDRNLEHAEGEAWDIADAIPLVENMEIAPSADYADLAGSRAVVITAGITVATGQDRLEILGANAGVIAGIVRELDRVAPDAVVVIASNPVDVLTRVSIETSTRPASQIFGAGTVLDGARLRTDLGRLLDVEDDSVHAYVLGEHGNSSFPVWSSATVGAVKLGNLELPEGSSWPEVQEQLAAAVQHRGARIHARKGYTSFGVAAALARLVRAITRDERRIFMVSTQASPAYGIGPAVLSLPCVVGATGVQRQLLLAMSPEEQRLLERSAATLDAAYRSLPASATPD